MVTKNPVISLLSTLLMLSLLGCVHTNGKETPVTTPTIAVTETPTGIPTSTSLPPPSPTLSYSYVPIISLANVTEVEKLDDFDGSVNSVAISPNGKYLAATFENGIGIIWDISNVKYLREWHEAPKDVFFSNGPVSFSSDSNILATGGTLLELPSKKTLQEIPGTVIFHPIGRSLASFDWTTISLWSFDGKQWILDHQQDTQGVVSVAFSPDGNLLGEALNWGGGEGVNIWRLSDHKLLYSFPPPEHSHPAHFNFFAYAFLAFSPDNHYVATGTKDQPIVRVWNLQSGELIRDLDTAVEIREGIYYVPDVACVSFSQDSKVIVIAGEDTIIFKKITDGELIAMLKIDTYGMSSSKSITACATSNDGKLLFTGDSDGDISIWGVLVPPP